MNFKKFFHEDIIFLLHAKTQEGLFKKMTEGMQKHGYVKETYLEAIKEREEIYPTGLQTEITGVAIPHTDHDHVNKEAIGIGVLEEPVPFKHMGMENVEVMVSVVFMLAIQKPDKQLGVLQVITGLIQDNELIKKIQITKDKKEILAIIHQYNDELNVSN
ncbi:PTS sugar transporter subunit IIA [Gracilibacillus suaedae]|uniref:PTS sugar transporter subunit IIA n=1 Tax=Gracilibacillus suaedae TaxID=2820273 RepID=UPI001ABDC8EE|nr:PTS sugar transporter subunit IIA [Gracilibacillus suaedae]